MEAVGLAFGVLPIVLEAVKSYKTTAERLNTLRRYVQAAYNLWLQHKIEGSSFRNECQLLLATVIDDANDLSEMLNDTNHSLWRDRTAENRLQLLLGQDYELCMEIVAKIREILRETENELSYLSEAEDMKDAPRRERYCLAFQVSVKENKHKKQLENLHDWNDKLQNLSSQHCRLRENTRFSSACIVRKQIPLDFASVRTSSQSLHDSLADAWSCADISHTGHQAKLALDAKYENGSVGLEMAISCRRRSPNSGTSSPPEPPTWLYVQSVTTGSLHSEPPTPQPPTTQPPTTQPSMLGSIAVSLRPKAQSSKKRVRFEVSADDEGPQPSSKETKTTAQVSIVDAQCNIMLDLRTSKSICSHLRQTGCLGYLEAKDTFRLVFYDASLQTTTRRAASHPITKDAMSLDKMLSKLTHLQQLTLAHKLVLAVLQYHSTPWLPHDWLLQDLAFFTDKPQASEDELLRDFETLHLSTQFSGKGTSLTQPEDQVNPAVNTMPSDEVKYRYNVRNMAMTKLGQALLEIAHKKDIHAFGYSPEPHDVIKARKILDKEPFPDIGVTYQDIVKKCMDCNFSVGYDLEDNDLQSAVYTEVACKLETLAERWKNFVGKA